MHHFRMQRLQQFKHLIPPLTIYSVMVMPIPGVGLSVMVG